MGAKPAAPAPAVAGAPLFPAGRLSGPSRAPATGDGAGGDAPAPDWRWRDPWGQGQPPGPPRLRLPHTPPSPAKDTCTPTASAGLGPAPDMRAPPPPRRREQARPPALDPPYLEKDGGRQLVNVRGRRRERLSAAVAGVLQRCLAARFTISLFLPLLLLGCGGRR